MSVAAAAGYTGGVCEGQVMCEEAGPVAAGLPTVHSTRLNSAAFLGVLFENRPLEVTLSSQSAPRPAQRCLSK